MAPLIDEVAVEALLWRKGQVLAVPNLDASLEHGVGSEEIAGATVALVDVPAREVVPIDILPVPALRHLVNVDVLKVGL